MELVLESMDTASQLPPDDLVRCSSEQAASAVAALAKVMEIETSSESTQVLCPRSQNSAELEPELTLTENPIHEIVIVENHLHEETASREDSCTDQDSTNSATLHTELVPKSYGSLQPAPACCLETQTQSSLTGLVGSIVPENLETMCMSQEVTVLSQSELVPAAFEITSQPEQGDSVSGNFETVSHSSDIQKDGCLLESFNEASRVVSENLKADLSQELRNSDCTAEALRIISKEISTSAEAETISKELNATSRHHPGKSNLVEIGVQANDYEIERRSGKVPARRRVIPFKFRDYRNPDLVDGDNGSDSDYSPSDTEVRMPKRKKISSTGRRPGRPRKIKIEEVAGENVSAAKTGEMEAAAAAKEPATRDTMKKSYASGFMCRLCCRVFAQRGNLKVHMRVHTGEKPFACNVDSCTKRFRNNESLRRHKLAHLGIKPFECDICHKKFSSKVSLQEHVAIHTKTKPHICHICQLPFRQISCLRRHLITHSNEKPFTCSECGQTFSQMVYLKSHSKVHTGEKPFVCDECGRGFAHQSDLSRHKIIHTGEKPFACNVCNARFSDPSSKRRHVKEHQGMKPFGCQLCGDMFKRAGQLKVHLTRKHSHTEVVKIIRQGAYNCVQFALRDNNSKTIQNEKATYHKKLVQLVDGLTCNTVHVATEVNANGEVMENQQEQIIDADEHGNTASQTQAVAQVVAAAMQSATSVTEVAEDGILSTISQSQDQADSLQSTTDQIAATLAKEIPYIDAQSAGPTVITIVSVEDIEQNQEQTERVAVPVEYAQQIIENAKSDGQQHFVELHYEQNKMQLEEELTSDDVTKVFQMDYVANPDFGSQDYYNWLSGFTEVCKLLSMPLDADLFSKISQVHKTLSDVMASPSGVLADRDNFKILMNISKDLHTIIQEHLSYILQNLDSEEHPASQK